mmetsp:Transcript_4633/g.6112  ORF Transcript_4633/g.6112 Transcript_4633/m.6112 type:complete len:219 (-) Transcript_4633:1427-2083(-)
MREREQLANQVSILYFFSNHHLFYLTNSLLYTLTLILVLLLMLQVDLVYIEGEPVQAKAFLSGGLWLLLLGRLRLHILLALLLGLAAVVARHDLLCLLPQVAVRLLQTERVIVLLGKIRRAQLADVLEPEPLNGAIAVLLLGVLHIRDYLQLLVVRLQGPQAALEANFAAPTRLVFIIGQVDGLPVAAHGREHSLRRLVAEVARRRVLLQHSYERHGL